MRALEKLLKNWDTLLKLCARVLAQSPAESFFEFIKKVPQDISQCEDTPCPFLTGHYCKSRWDGVQGR